MGGVLWVVTRSALRRG